MRRAPMRRAAPRRPVRPLVIAGVLAVALLGGCAAATPPAPVAAPAPAATPVPAPATQAPVPCDPVPGWSCDQTARFAAVRGRIDALPGPDGYFSVSVTDRSTGATWTAGDTAHPGWTASTIKLAIATDLLERGEATGDDRADMDAMLHSSDNAATDRLWRRHGGDAMLARFRDRFGMTGVAFQPGFTARTYWGFVKCTTADLAVLGRYVLERTAPADRAYLVDALRGVAPNQQWGVWAAGPEQRPGNKDGWSREQDDYGRHWVADTVGFAGPDERYVVAVMYQVPPPGSLEDGIHAVSDVVALLFGRPVPAPVSLPPPDDRD